MTQTGETLCEALLEAARKAGADAADTIVLSTTALEIDVRGGALERAERAESLDVGLRVFCGRKQACVATSDGSKATVASMAERAVAMAREAPDDPHIGLADPGEITTRTDTAALDLWDEAPEPSPQDLQAQAGEAEAAALAIEGVTQIDAASAGYTARRVSTAASNGFQGSYGRTSHSLSCVAIAGAGLSMERDYDFDARSHASDMRGATEIGTRAGQRAVERLDPIRPPTGAYPVLFDERIAASLVGHLLSAINGVSIARGASWLRGALGETVLPAGIDLIEDPHRPRASGSRLFDAEGLATTRRAIVADGVLQGWTLDLATARKLGLQSTANAARNVSAPPSPVSWNVALTQGPASRAELIAQMQTGLIVTSMIGSTINPNTGDYSRGASGFWVEKGEITRPVSEVTIAGNLRDMLRGLVPANDARPHLSRVVPSLLVDGMTLAGS